ncbi:hemolysin secretion protein D [Pseudoxanthomonas kalamensis DSM 18571]|uniref:HlyD family secretion protein n=1 Tax=Pseudoxanthomonas kalamensis TaxID=289483 RepID=UPI00139146C0|nr:HlyD family efflux transporter periplasmic adaptor subunit [Pseudoxanthomonas kalamensis]KAF1709286.1 hemolysin secretion protein D [Pseudoxanthomonas kalamensis DSM 18571]
MSKTRIVRMALPLLAALLLPACTESAPQVLGTLEWDRITLPSPAAEKIVAIDVHEGQQVAAGTVLLQLEAARTQSQLQAVQAQAEQSGQALAELQAGPRREDIDRARAELAAAQAQARDARANYNRLRPLGQRQLVSAASVDSARASADSAEAQVRAAQQALLELERGTRSEQLAQGQAALAAASAQADVQAVTLEKLSLTAPRAARVDSIPYKLGDQAPVGAPLMVLLAGDAPYARVYIPEPLRAGVQVGDAAKVHIDGDATVYEGKVRSIRSDPTFTPYYALSGDDAARLSYLAEIQLGVEAAQLPAGVPVRAEFAK